MRYGLFNAETAKLTATMTYNRRVAVQAIIFKHVFVRDTLSICVSNVNRTVCYTRRNIVVGKREVGRVEISALPSPPPPFIAHGGTGTSLTSRKRQKLACLQTAGRRGGVR